MGDNFLVSGLIVKYVSVNYIKTFQFKMFYHVISTVKMLYGFIPDDDPCLSSFAQVNFFEFGGFSNFYI